MQTKNVLEYLTLNLIYKILVKRRGHRAGVAEDIGSL